MVHLGRRRRPERRVARYGWPAALGAAGLAWYGADSLRHRRESGHGYDLRGELDVSAEELLRAAEALTGACYLAIAAARESIDLTAAYFVPRPAFAEALQDAAERGVRVRVLVPGSNIDKPPVRVAGRASYDELVGSGVEIYEYQPTMLHAKTLTVDGHWSGVGSANFDNRSFQLNDEATLCVSSDEFAGLLGDQFERDLEVSERITGDRRRQRGAVQRAAESVLKLGRREL